MLVLVLVELQHHHLQGVLQHQVKLALQMWAPVAAAQLQLQIQMSRYMVMKLQLQLQIQMYRYRVMT